MTKAIDENLRFYWISELNSPINWVQSNQIFLSSDRKQETNRQILDQTTALVVVRGWTKMAIQQGLALFWTRAVYPGTKGQGRRKQWGFIARTL